MRFFLVALCPLLCEGDVVYACLLSVRKPVEAGFSFLLGRLFYSAVSVSFCVSLSSNILTCRLLEISNTSASIGFIIILCIYI